MSELSAMSLESTPQEDYVNSYAVQDGAGAANGPSPGAEGAGRCPGCQGSSGQRF